jgi:hypothetical protein
VSIGSLIKDTEAAVNTVEKAGATYGKVLNPVKTAHTDINKAAEEIQAASEKYKINPAYLWGVYGTESSFGTNTKDGGPFQFEPAEAKEYGYPTGVNETGISNFNWSAFTKQAEAAARLLVANGIKSNPRAALEKYNSGKAGDDETYYNKVIEAAKSFSDSFVSEDANKAETAKTEEATPSGAGASLVGEIFAKLGTGALTGVLVLAGVILMIYGIMVAVGKAPSKIPIPAA